MIADLAAVIAPVFLAVLVGFLWARAGQPFDGDLVSRLVMVVGAPALIVATLDKTPLSVSVLAEVVSVYALVMGITVAASLACMAVLGLAWRSWFNALVFPNVGNMGLPLCLFAFGDKGLALALAWFMVNSLLHFSVGPMVASGERNIMGFLHHPIIWSVLAAVVMVIGGLQLPAWLASTVTLLGQMTIPLMLITLGVSLHGLPMSNLRDGAAVALLRLAIGLLAGVGICLLLDLEGTLRGVVIIQSVMPVAVFNYLFAQRYQRDAGAVAASVVVSTLLAFLLLPVLLALVMPAG